MSENNPAENRFGETIRNARQAKGLTQKQLGMLCGYEIPKTAERTVQFWEHNQSPVPIDRLRRLCAALDLPLDALIP